MTNPNRGGLFCAIIQCKELTSQKCRSGTLKRRPCRYKYLFSSQHSAISGQLFRAIRVDRAIRAVRVIRVIR